MAEDERAETLLGEAETGGAFGDDAVEGQDALRGLDGEGGVVGQAGRAVERQAASAAEGEVADARSEREVVVQRARGRIGLEEGSVGGDGKHASAQRTVSEGGNDAEGVTGSGRTAGDEQTARVHGDAAAKEAGAGKLEQAVAGLGDADGRVVRGAADRRRDGEGRRGVGHGGVAVDRNRADVERAGRTTEVDGNTASACTRDSGDGADVDGSSCDVAGQGQDAGAGGNLRASATAVIAEGQAGEGLIEVVQSQQTDAVDGWNHGIVDLAVRLEPDFRLVDDEVTIRDCDGASAVGTSNLEVETACEALAAVDDGAPCVGIGTDERCSHSVERSIDQAGQTTGAVIDDGRVDVHRGALVHEKIQGLAASSGAACSEEAVTQGRADALTGEVAGDNQRTRSEVQDVRVIGEGKRLAVCVGGE